MVSSAPNPGTGPRAPSAPLLDVRDVTLRYRTTSRLITAAYRINFQAFAGDRLILLGPSGCGKSSLLKSVAGFLRPIEGSILLDGEEVRRPGPDRVVVFQEFDQLLPWKTVLENVVFALKSGRGMNRNEAREQARIYLAKVHLTEFAHAYPHTLSGGMKQRAAIARCLAMRPRIVLMDEPFAALDALTRRRMQHELLTLWAEYGFTLIFVTHSISEAMRLGSRVILLSAHPGQVRAELNVPAEHAHADESDEAFRHLHDRIEKTLFKDMPEYSI